jgi:hypothetical protein
MEIKTTEVRADFECNWTVYLSGKIPSVCERHDLDATVGSIAAMWWSDGRLGSAQPAAA